MAVRALLRRLGARHGIALGAIVVIVGVLVIARMGGNPTGSLVTGGTDRGLVPSGSPAPDDGAASVPAPQPPTTSPGASTPQDVAMRFATAWLHHTGVTAATWRAVLAPMSTARLGGELTNADPETVPANNITGPVSLTDHSATYVEADVPTDSGTLVLSLLAAHGQWRVDAIDWEPA
jgi:phage-related tail fiber protein